MKPSRQNRGFTIAETVVGAGLTTLALFGALTTLLYGMSSWYRGQGKISAESSSQVAIRQASRELREAMSVTVDNNGQGLTYRKPAVDSNGTYTMPIAWDGVTRRIELSGSTLQLNTNGALRPIAQNIITTDPQSTNGASAYTIFSPGNGSITRSITMMVVIQNNSYQAENITSRS